MIGPQVTTATFARTLSCRPAASSGSASSGSASMRQRQIRSPAGWERSGTQDMRVFPPKKQVPPTRAPGAGRHLGSGSGAFSAGRYEGPMTRGQLSIAPPTTMNGSVHPQEVMMRARMTNEVVNAGGSPWASSLTGQRAASRSGQAGTSPSGVAVPAPGGTLSSRASGSGPCRTDLRYGACTGATS